MNLIRPIKWTDNLILCCAIVYFASTFLDVAHAGIDDFAMLISAMLVVVFSALQTRGKIALSIESFHVSTFLFVAYCWISCLWAVDVQVTQIVTRVITLTLILLYALYIYYRRKSIDAMLMTAMLGGYAVCIMMLYEQGLDTYLRAIVLGTRVYDYDFINANVMGMLAASSLLINFYYIIYQKKIRWWTVGGVFALICVAGAGSKKSIILLFGGGVMLILLHNFNEKKKLFSMLKMLFLGSIICVFIYFVLTNVSFFSGVMDRFSGVTAYITGKGKIDYSTAERASFMRAGLSMFKKYPFFGCGINCPRVINPLRATYLHNNYLELLAGGGILAFLLYYGMYVYLLYEMWKYRAFRTPEYDICLTLLLLHLALEYAYVSYYNKETYFYFMIFFLEVQQLKNLRRCKQRKG